MDRRMMFAQLKPVQIVKIKMGKQLFFPKRNSLDRIYQLINKNRLAKYIEIISGNIYIEIKDLWQSSITKEEVELLKLLEE